MPTTRASPSASAKPRATASCAASAFRLTSKPAALRRRRRSARSAPASACGNPPKCGSIRPARSKSSPARHAHGQGHETTFAQVVSERLGIPIDNISIVHGDTDKVQFGMGTYGSRSGAVGMSALVKALDKVEAKAKKVAAHHARSRRRRHRVQGRQVLASPAPTSPRPGATSRSTPISRTNSPARNSSPA